MLGELQSSTWCAAGKWSFNHTLHRNQKVIIINLKLLCQHCSSCRTLIYHTRPWTTPPYNWTSIPHRLSHPSLNVPSNHTPEVLFSNFSAIGPCPIIRNTWTAHRNFLPLEIFLAPIWNQNSICTFLSEFLQFMARILTRPNHPSLHPTGVHFYTRDASSYLQGWRSSVSLNCN